MYVYAFSVINMRVRVVCMKERERECVLVREGERGERESYEVGEAFLTFLRSVGGHALWMCCILDVPLVPNHRSGDDKCSSSINEVLPICKI